MYYNPIFSQIYNFVKNNDSFEFDSYFQKPFFLLSKEKSLSKFKILDFYIHHKNNLFDLNNRINKQNKILEIFNRVQYYYHILLRFKNKVHFKYAKKFDSDVDLNYNSFEDYKPHLKMNILENGILYKFSLTDLVNIFNESLLYNCSFFLEPKLIKNPYTNLNFKKHNLYNIYFSLLNTNFHIPFPIQKFFLDEFNLKKFKNNNEVLLRDEIIKNFKRIKVKETIIDIKKMINYYNSCTNTALNIHFDKSFPKKKLLECFNKYLIHYYYINYTNDQNKKFFNKRLLIKKLKTFKARNEKFGRKYIIIKENHFKNLYFMSKLYYENNITFFSIINIKLKIPEPYMLDFKTRSFFIGENILIKNNVYENEKYTNSNKIIQVIRTMYFSREMIEIINTKIINEYNELREKHKIIKNDDHENRELNNQEIMNNERMVDERMVDERMDVERTNNERNEINESDQNIINLISEINRIGINNWFNEDRIDNDNYTINTIESNDSIDSIDSIDNYRNDFNNSSDSSDSSDSDSIEIIINAHENRQS